ncbi:hypothetical protein WCD74_01985 [Actinomycetospora sp. OC33-EN08]|uniref:Transmembrane protein n=1 Tax=Actinomycetospora aurantiaca TaxID=3129233 RepID=A0ABU8MHB4_9PSEU
MGMGTGVDRLRTTIFPRRSALRRRSDRVETTVLRLAVLALLLLVPFLVVLGNHGAREAAAEAERTRAVAHPVTATILATPPGTGPAAAYPGGLSTVDVAWVEPDLTRHTATVTAPPTIQAGETLPLWIGPGDRPVVPPAGATDAVVEGIVDAVGALVAATALLTGLVLAVRFALDRARMREWDADWWAFVHRRDRGTTG